MTQPGRPLSPESAAQIIDALKRGDVVACWAKCWPCQFGQCTDEPHTWMDDEDREHAGILADTPLSQLATEKPCGCRCNSGARGAAPEENR